MLRSVRMSLTVIILGFGYLRAQTPAASAIPHATVDAFLAYTGTWRIEIDTVKTPYSKAGRKQTTLQNDCWKSGQYVACRQIVDGESKILIVFTCTRPDNYCTSYQIPADGGNPSSSTMLVEGNTWTFPWQTTEGGKTTYFRIVNVWSSSSSIDYRQEFSTDQANWTLSASGHELKTSLK